MLAEEGAKLTVTYRANRERAEEFRSVATLVPMDLRSADDRARVLDLVRDLYGLVIFAGVPARVRRVEELEGVTRISFQDNFLGPMLMAREVAGYLRANSIAGAIVLIASMQAVHPFPASTAYSTQKAALVHAAKVLAKETRGPYYIRVNVVCPGVTDAGMAQESIAAGKYERYLEEQIIPRYGQAQDVARAVRFFLEPDNYVTGQVLTVDGGLTL
jgi:NAD(P)-dependent dehydrogenase (short-subunit alcohol dehydrogenase family)